MRARVADALTRSARSSWLAPQPSFCLSCQDVEIDLLSQRYCKEVYREQAKVNEEGLREILVLPPLVLAREIPQPDNLEARLLKCPRNRFTCETADMVRSLERSETS